MKSTLNACASDVDQSHYSLLFEDFYLRAQQAFLRARVENALPLYEIEKNRASDRRGTRTDLTSGKNFPQVKWGRAREAIADLIGLSDRTVEKALYRRVWDVIEGLKDRLRWSQKPPSIDNAYRREIVEPRPTPVMSVNVP